MFIEASQYGNRGQLTPTVGLPTFDPESWIVNETCKRTIAVVPTEYWARYNRKHVG